MSDRVQLRFGILLNDLSVQRWQADCVEALLGDRRIHLSVLILPATTPQPPPQKAIWQRFDRNALYKLYRRFLMAVPALDTVKPEWLDTTPQIACEVETRGASQYFSDDAVSSVSDQKLDFILRFGFNILRGDILKAARFGIWSFHHGDEQLYRGGPPGFWETLHGKHACGAILQRLTEQLDGGVILRKGWFALAPHALSETHETLLQGTATWPLQAARAILAGTLDPHALEATKTEAPVYRFPKNGAMLRFLFKLLRNTIRFHLRQLFAPEHWNVAIVDQPLESLLKNDPKDAQWLPRQPAHLFRADAFGFLDEDRAVILYEQFNQHTQRGEIHAQIDGKEVGAVLPTDEYHRSYPFVFKYASETYCIPESHERHSIDLFKWHSADGRFKWERTLVKDASLTDPTLCEIEGTWWLFCTPREWSNTALCLYYAHTPFGPFEAHANNPVKWDIRSARPGGQLFQVDGSWYRPAQDCSKSYGSRLVLQRIAHISQQDYREEHVRDISPLAPYDSGLHTASRFGNKTLIDGKVYRFSWAQCKHQLRRKLGRIAKR